MCEEDVCAVTWPAGMWSTWSEWSPCPVTCGMSKVLRSRVCRPRPGSPSRHCPGDAHQSRDERCGGECHTGGWVGVHNVPPPLTEIAEGCQITMWTLWGPWSSCSKTCGPGYKRRRRHCDVIQPGRRCGSSLCSEVLEDSEQQEECEELPCPCEVRDWSEWSVWSSCSVSCGQGMQTRKRSCHVTTIGQQCPMSDRCGSSGGRRLDERRCQDGLCRRYEFSDWHPWSDCDCNTGKIHRRRDCHSVTLTTGSKIKVDMSNCHDKGVARQEMGCDVRDMCPECITSCRGQPDGTFPSCLGCQHYFVCAAQNETRFRCKIARTQFDSFIGKCVSPPSHSCTLVLPVADCSGRPDDTYPSRLGCNHYVQCLDGVRTDKKCRHVDLPAGEMPHVYDVISMRGAVTEPRHNVSHYDYLLEYNHHRRRCEYLSSPTCVKREDVRRENGGRWMFSDAPMEMYYDEEEGEELELVERRNQKIGKKEKDRNREGEGNKGEGEGEDGKYRNREKETNAKGEKNEEGKIEEERSGVSEDLSREAELDGEKVEGIPKREELKLEEEKENQKSKNNTDNGLSIKKKMDRKNEILAKETKRTEEKEIPKEEQEKEGESSKNKDTSWWGW